MTLTTAQFARRTKGIGSSEIAAVCGVDPHKSVRELWDYKITGRKEDIPRLEAYAEWGVFMEPVIADWYARHKVDDLDYLLNIPDTIIHPSIPWALAHPDRYVVWRSTGIPAWGIEIKHRQAGDKGRWTSKHAPCEVAAQAHWGMFVSGLDRWDCVASVGGAPPCVVVLERDDELLGAMRTVGLQFQNDVDEKREPEQDWVKGEIELIQARLCDETDVAAFKSAAWWRKREGK